MDNSHIERYHIRHILYCVYVDVMFQRIRKKYFYSCKKIVKEKG